MSNSEVEPDGGFYRFIPDYWPNLSTGWLEIMVGVVAPFVRIEGHDESEITGPAFTPDGTRLCFLSQRGMSGDGITFEVTGPFRGGPG